MPYIGKCTAWFGVAGWLAGGMVGTTSVEAQIGQEDISTGFLAHRRAECIHPLLFDPLRNTGLDAALDQFGIMRICR